MIRLILLIALSSCTTTNTSLEMRMSTVEQQQARQYYLLRCSFCDVYAAVGSPENEQCIVRETELWMKIKRTRGWN